MDETISMAFISQIGDEMTHRIRNKTKTEATKKPRLRISLLIHEPIKLFMELGAFMGFPKCNSEIIAAIPSKTRTTTSGDFHHILNEYSVFGDA